ncbi:hypothetical protein ACFWF7_18095 [Nocardia sp. NPDC060256]|uniref:hypothetical protein n=1 Tax=unclassified Nocardia TaxID=2637762 RepID=UPI00365A52E7
MFEQLTIGSWVIVDEQCSVRLAPVHRDEYLTFVFDSNGNEFEFAVAPAMLRRMAELAAAPSVPDDPD